MPLFFIYYCLVSSVCVGLIEALKWSASFQPDPIPETALSIIALPPKPEGVPDTQESGEGAVHYTQEKCEQMREQYRDLCFHQLARQWAVQDLVKGKKACLNIQKDEEKWECMSDIAEQYAPVDKQASMALCPEIKKKKWRDQCVFGIALSLSTTDSKWAFRTCDKAGKWRDFCRHDVNGEIAVVNTDMALEHCAAEEGDLLRRKSCWHGIGKYIARVDVDAAFRACARVPLGPDNLYRENCIHGLGWGASEKAGKAFADRCYRAGDQKDSCLLGVAYNLKRFDQAQGLRLCDQVQRSDLQGQCKRFLTKGSIHR